LSFEALKGPEHRKLHPFGQIPSYEQGDLVLFESGAIVLHIASEHAGLLPEDRDGRARAIAWMFAALSTVEPPIDQFGMAAMLERDEPWFAARQPMLEARVHTRLTELAARLGSADWLDGEFSAGDLMMVAVLRRLKVSRLLERYPALAAYVARAEARPAFARAFAAQLAVHTAAAG
jgi:glutathione S-transferase